MIPSNPRLWLKIFACLLLISGLLTSLWLYREAVAQEANQTEDSGFGPDGYPLEFEYSKRYAREMEVMGGKSAILLNDLSNWLQGLWQGKKRAYSLAGLSLLACLVCFRGAELLPGPAKTRLSAPGQADPGPK